MFAEAFLGTGKKHIRKPLKGSRCSVNIGRSYGKEAHIIKWIKQIAVQNMYNNIIPSMFKIIIKAEIHIYLWAYAYLVI